jgi:arsenate reductase (thioredoxin)
VTAHWGVPDPAAVRGTEAQRRRAFLDAYLALENRTKIFVALPIDKLDRMALKRKVDEIGRVAGRSDGAAMTTVTEISRRRADGARNL